MFVYGLVFVGWVLHPLVSVLLSRSFEGVVAVGCLTGSTSDSLTGVATGGPG